MKMPSNSLLDDLRYRGQSHRHAPVAFVVDSDERRYDTPETPYETHYFTVDIDESDGLCIGYNMNMIGSVTVDEDGEMVAEVENFNHPD